MESIIAFPKYARDEAPPVEKGHIRLAVPKDVAETLTYEQLSALNEGLRGNRRQRLAAQRRCRSLGIAIVA